MNNKEFISELSKRLGRNSKDTTDLVNAMSTILLEQLEGQKVIAVQGFGSFEVKKKMERVSVNPATQLRMLVPPKLVLSYKPSTVLKEKYKNQ